MKIKSVEFIMKAQKADIVEFTVGENGVEKITVYNLNEKVVSIEHKDGEVTRYVGIPFVAVYKKV